MQLAIHMCMPMVFSVGINRLLLVLYQLVLYIARVRCFTFMFLVYHPVPLRLHKSLELLLLPSLLSNSS